MWIPCIVISACLTTQAQNPDILWTHSYGGSDQDIFYSFEPTSDYGFLLIGDSRSNDGDIQDSARGTDALLMKIDANGQLQWENEIGGSNYDHSYTAQQIHGGYIVSIESKSDDGDSPGNHDNYDFLCMKLDWDGNILWAKDFGGSKHDHPTCIKQTVDGGFIMAGGSASNDGDVSNHHGTTNTMDVWVVKLDSLGNLIWSKSIGGTENDFGLYVQCIPSGGYVVVGESISNDGDFSGHHGTTPNEDLLVMKLDNSGNIQWQKFYGGSLDDVAHYVTLTPEGGFLIAGATNSTDGDVSINKGKKDYWILKLRSNGKIAWQKTYGGSNGEAARFIDRSNDGGYVVAGECASSDGDVITNHGQNDCWVIGIDAHGNLKWQKSLGGSSDDSGKSVAQLSDGSVVVGCSSNSTNGDVTDHHGLSGTTDFWIVKLGTINEAKGISALQSKDALTPPATLSVYPNPSLGNFTVTLETGASENCEAAIEVINLLGQSYSIDKGQWTVDNGRLMKEIQMSDVADGMYLVKVTVGDKIFTAQIDLQK